MPYMSHPDHMHLEQPDTRHTLTGSKQPTAPWPPTGTAMAVPGGGPGSLRSSRSRRRRSQPAQGPPCGAGPVRAAAEPQAERATKLPIVVPQPGTVTGGRPVTINGSAVGLAHDDRGLIELLRRAGLYDADHRLDDPLR